jgi:hypothetical protein
VKPAGMVLTYASAAMAQIAQIAGIERMTVQS